MLNRSNRMPPFTGKVFDLSKEAAEVLDSNVPIHTPTGTLFAAGSEDWARDNDKEPITMRKPRRIGFSCN